MVYRNVTLAHFVAVCGRIFWGSEVAESLRRECSIYRKEAMKCMFLDCIFILVKTLS